MVTWKEIRSAVSSLGAMLAGELLGWVLFAAICVGIWIALSTESEMVYHSVMATMVLVPALLFFYFGFRGGRKNLTIWRVGFLMFGLILAPFYVIVTLDRLGWLS